MDGWVDGWMEVKAVLRIAYSNQKSELSLFVDRIEPSWLLYSETRPS
jgi:hypothetical protein